MEQVGLDSVPLVALLSFMVGAVIAFLGAMVLQDFGATIYIVELVNAAFLREFGVLLTAILLAGRTASAFTAQIGMMVNREEAVSYTHLDVYKRQTNHSRRANIQPRQPQQPGHRTRSQRKPQRQHHPPCLLYTSRCV